MYVYVYIYIYTFIYLSINQLIRRGLVPVAAGELGGRAGRAARHAREEPARCRGYINTYIYIYTHNKVYISI